MPDPERTTPPTFWEYLKTRGSVIPFILTGGLLWTYLEGFSTLKGYLTLSTLTVTSWMFMWLGNEYLADYLDYKIKWTEQPLRRFAVGMVVMVVYTTTTIVLLMKTFEWLYNTNIRYMRENLYITVAITFVITLFMTSRSFLFSWKKAAVAAEKFEKESSIARYESLKNQVNPHFLFNAFTALSNLVYEDQDKAVKFIKQLSDVYRYVLDTRDKETVTLAEEKKFLESYLFLQQIRFGHKLKLNINIPPADSVVAPLVLQMLVENAIKHNIISEDNPLTIDIFADNGYLVVRNNLQKKTVTLEESPGLGLDNIMRRYGFLTDKPVQCVADDYFTVKIPIIPA